VTVLKVAKNQISKRGRSGLGGPDSGGAAGEVSWVQLDREGPGTSTTARTASQATLVAISQCSGDHDGGDQELPCAV
jgi:hypothetical protein